MQTTSSGARRRHANGTVINSAAGTYTDLCPVRYPPLVKTTSCKTNAVSTNASVASLANG